VPEVKNTKKGKKTVDNTATSQQQLEEFVDDMLTEKNLPGLSDDVRPDVIKEVVQTLQELINRAIINALPDDKLEEISKRIEDENTSLVQIQDLVQQSGIDTEKIVTNTLIEFRRLYLAGSPGSQER
jgi:methionine aminopeptidase